MANYVSQIIKTVFSNGVHMCLHWLCLVKCHPSFYFIFELILTIVLPTCTFCSATILTLRLDLYTMNLSSFSLSKLRFINTLISDTHCSISDNISVRQSYFLIVIYSCVSSAYDWCSIPKRWMMSDTGLVYKQYIICPRTEHCGTPNYSSCLSDSVALICIRCSLSDK